MLHAIFAHGWEDARLPRGALRERRRAARVGRRLPARARRRGDRRPGGRHRRRGARWYATTPRAFLVYGLGVTQHVCGTENVIALSNLALVTGHVGVEGAGHQPAARPEQRPGRVRHGRAARRALGLPAGGATRRRGRRFGAAWGARAARAPGPHDARRCSTPRTTARCAACSSSARIRSSPIPAQHDVQRALDALDCLVVVELFLTETAQLADVVLPAASFAEKDGTFTSTERRVQRVRRAVDAARRRARRLGDPGGARRPARPADGLHVGRADLRRDGARSRRSTRGMSYARLERRAASSGRARDATHPGTPVLHREQLHARRAAASSRSVDTPPAELPDAEYPLQLTTFRLAPPVRLGLDDPAGAAPRAREPARPPLDPSRRRGARATSSTGTPGARPLAARRGDDARASSPTTCRPGMVAMPYHFREAPSNLRHQRRARSDLAHARAEGLRGRRGARADDRPRRAPRPRRRRRAARARSPASATLYEVRRDARRRPTGARRAPAAPFDWDAPLPLAGGEAVLLPAARDAAPLARATTRAEEPAGRARSRSSALRACDLTAIAYQDRFFARDPWYAGGGARRRCSSASNCLAACAGGFCRRRRRRTVRARAASISR